MLKLLLATVREFALLLLKEQNSGASGLRSKLIKPTAGADGAVDSLRMRINPCVFIWSVQGCAVAAMGSRHATLSTCARPLTLSHASLGLLKRQPRTRELFLILDDI